MVSDLGGKKGTGVAEAFYHVLLISGEDFGHLPSLF